MIYTFYLKDLIWEDIQVFFFFSYLIFLINSQKLHYCNKNKLICYSQEEFEILEASDSRTKRKLLQTMGERWRQFKSDLTRKWALAVDHDGVDDTVCEKYGISKEKWAQICQTRRDPSWEVCSLPFKLFFKKY